MPKKNLQFEKFEPGIYAGLHISKGKTFRDFMSQEKLPFTITMPACGCSVTYRTMAELPTKSVACACGGSDPLVRLPGGGIMTEGLTCWKCGKTISFPENEEAELYGLLVTVEFKEGENPPAELIEYNNRQLGKYSDGTGQCRVALCYECYIDRQFGIESQ